MKTTTKIKLTPQIVGMYLGCGVKIINNSELDKKYWIGKSVGIYKLAGTICWIISVEYNGGNKVEHYIRDCKLILRSLEDMTDKEYTEWTSLYFNKKSKIETKDIIFNESKRTAWLINRGFDLFQLIKNNLAIRKKK